MEYFEQEKYKASAEMPVYTDHQRRLLEALRVGGIEELSREVYRIAYEPEPGMDYSFQLIIDDKEKKAYEVLRLLYTVPIQVLEAVILNNIGHLYQESIEGRSNFRDLFYEQTDSCQGVYIATLLIDRSSRGLNVRQWKEVKKIMERYNAGREIKITDKSTQEEIDDYELAAKIESYYPRRSDGASNDQIQLECKQGYRYFDGREVCRRLGIRINHSYDPSEGIQQQQTPAYVGLSSSLPNRIAAYQPLGNLRGACKDWVFTCACMRSAGIRLSATVLTIFKCFGPGHLELGEVLLTILAGSMQYDSGFNGVGPGRKASNIDNRNAEKWRVAQMEIFLQRPFFDQNREIANTIRERLDAAIKFHEMVLWRPESGKPKPQSLLDWEKGEQELKDIEEKVMKACKNLDEMLKEREKAIEDYLKDLDGRLAEVKFYKDNKEEFEKFKKDWDAAIEKYGTAEGDEVGVGLS
ncbi:hypothetical protein NHQ30_007794 [Ciborinia camelliae]|nr:hypothetical protein NHQ30_007794 [Ciborinia camelliae]